MKFSKPGKAWLWLPTFSWALLVFAFLSLPVDLLLALIFPASDDPSRWMFPHADKLTHALLFGVMAFLLFRPFTQDWGLSPLLAAGAAFVASSMYGLTMEIIQSFLPYRQADAGDVLANAAGAALIFLRPAWRRLNKEIDQTRADTP